jgi:hypothetical protein
MISQGVGPQNQIKSRWPLAQSLALGLIASILLSSYAQAVSVNELLKSSTVQKLQSKWQKFKINGKLGTSQGMQVSDSGFIAGDIGYRFNILPAADSKHHQRLDSFHLGASLGGADILNLGLRGSLQVSFSRVYQTKREAILKAPPLLTEIPSTSKEVIDQMLPGDAVRLEISTGQSLTPNFLGTLISSSNVGLGAGVEKGTGIFIELYRLQNNHLRVRLISDKNSGSLQGAFNIKPYVDFGVLDKVLGGLLSCRPVDFSANQSLEGRPKDTMVVDYTLNLNAEVARVTFDKVFAEVLNLNFSKQLFRLKSESDFGNGLWDTARPFDLLYKRQKAVPPEFQVISRSFKARMLSLNTSLSLGSSCFKIWKLLGQEFNLVSSVRTYDSEERTKDFLYMNSVRDGNRTFVAKSLNSGGHHNFEILYNVSRLDDQNANFINLDSVTDFVISSSSTEEKVTRADRRQLVGDFKYQFRVFSNDVPIESLLLAAKDEKRDVDQNILVSFDPVALKNLPLRSAEQFMALLRDYVTKYPFPNLLPLTNKPSTVENRKAAIEFDVKFIGTHLAKALDPQASPEVFYEEFKILRKNPLFSFISAGFLINLVPPEQLQSTLHFSYVLRSKDENVFVFNFNEDRRTELFKAVSNILGTLNNRSFDVVNQVNELQ